MSNCEAEDNRAIELGAEIIAAMDNEFHDASDRVLAIVGAAYLDSLLEELFRAVFIDEKKEVDDLLGIRGALSAYGTRCQLAFCLGIIDRYERDDLGMVAKIRNAFAHKYDVQSFDHQEVGKFIERLHVGKELDEIVAGLSRNTSDPDQRQHLHATVTGRRKFQDTVRNLFVVLLHKLNKVRRSSKPNFVEILGIDRKNR